jgi:perosamine synthetase
MADGAAFAFYPNKQITTGEGGAIVTNDSDVARLCRSMRNQGRGEDGVWLCHERLGFNYRLSELHAALGVVQMKRLDSIMARRARVAALYNTRLADSEFVSPPYVAPQVSRMSWQVFVVRVRNDIDRDMVMNRLSRAGIGCRPYFTPIHLQPLYVREFGYKPGDFPVAEQVGRQTIALPFFNALSENQVDYVCGELESACRKCVKPGRRSFRVAPPWLRSGAARREVAAAAGS